MVIAEIIEDTLKTRGKWSAKRITAFASFSYSCFLATCALYRGEFEAASVVIGEYLMATLVLFGVMSWQKQFIQQPEDEESTDKGKPNARPVGRDKLL